MNIIKRLLCYKEFTIEINHHDGTEIITEKVEALTSENAVMKVLNRNGLREGTVFKVIPDK